MTRVCSPSLPESFSTGYRFETKFTNIIDVERKRFVAHSYISGQLVHHNHIAEHCLDISDFSSSHYREQMPKNKGRQKY